MTLASCKTPWKAGSAPGAQVVASVGPQKVTLDDLRAEMPGPPPADAIARKAAEDSTLRNIVARDILARAARERGLDRTPSFQRAEARIIDTMLVQALQQKLAADVPAPTRVQAQAYVAQHPDIFARRKIFVLDQIRMARPSDPALVKALAPLKTLDQIAALLTQYRTPFQRDTARLDAVGANPALVGAVASLPAGELFVLPDGAVLSVNRVVQTVVVPFGGEPAIAYAQKTLSEQNIQVGVQAKLKALFAQAEKRVKFAKGYSGADPMAAFGSGPPRLSAPPPGG